MRLSAGSVLAPHLPVAVLRTRPSSLHGAVGAVSLAGFPVAGAQRGRGKEAVEFVKFVRRRQSSPRATRCGLFHQLLARRAHVPGGNRSRAQAAADGARVW